MNEARQSCNGSLEDRVAEVVDAFMDEVHAGARPDVEEYARRYPELAGVLRQVLPALEVMGPGESGEEVRDGGLPGRGCLGDFRIVREVGRGGMGVVYEAEQLSLGRRVALKVLPFAATMDPRHLQRFHNEARAAACLRHEHIVPVHAVGCERGVHFYAMQFVEGQSLAELIAQLRRPAEPSGPAGAGQPTTAYAPADGAARTAPAAALTTEPGPRDAAYHRRVAEWGVQAAGALEHAHALGIVHRDVKPGNLLIDAQGRLCVTDFGLARSAADTGLTLTGDVLGTLRYMSPEQALAKHNLVDHRTDVYGLGATLYELLTLQPAVGGRDRQEILQQIAACEAVPPRKRNPAVPADLETVVLKAMAREPQERYATAQELADDLRRFLGHEPVRARRAGPWARARKWVRRRPALAGLLAVTGLSLVTLVVGLAWHNHRLREEVENTARERDAAREEQRWARRAVDDMYTQVAERWLACQPRLQPLQREFLQKALLYYRRATSADDPSPEARRELGQAYLRVGTIQYTLGSLPEAEQAYRRAEEVLQGLSDAQPGDAEARSLLAVTWARLGELLNVTGRHPAAEEVSRKAIAALERSVKEGVASPDDQAHLADSYARLGLAIERARSPGDAEGTFRKALSVREGLAARSPSNPEYQRALAWALNDLGRVLVVTQQFKLAQEVLERGVRAAELAVKGDPEAGAYLVTLGDLRYAVAILYYKTNQLPKSEQSLRRALEALARVVSEYPHVPRYREDLGGMYNVLGVVTGDLGRPKESEEAYREAIRIKTRLVKENPTVPLYREDLVQALNNLTGLLGSPDRRPEAERVNAEARRHAERLVKDFPGDAAFRKDLARAHQNRAGIDLAAGRPGAAAREWKRALEASSHPDIRDGAAQFLTQCPDPKYRDLPRAVELARENVQAAPENFGYWETLGQAEYRAGHPGEAIRALRKAVQLGSREPDVRLLLAMALRAAGDREEGRRQYDAVREQLKKSGSPAASGLIAEATRLFDAEGEGAPHPREKR